jgi:enoyl-[acyl-carrier protein] reductase III
MTGATAAPDADGADVVSRTAAVIGGSRGIGRAAAVALARRGYGSVFLSYRSDTAAAELAARDVRDAGAQAILVPGDVTVPANLALLGKSIDRHGAGLHALVYSAGYRALGPADVLDGAAWSRALDITLTGFVRSVQELTPRMAAGAKVVGVSGLSGLRAYSTEHMTMGTAKAASHHAMRYLAWKLATRRINLNMACFGAVRTEGVERDLSPAQYEEFVARAEGSNPLGRLCSASEAGEVIAFLCSSGADFLVGQVIVADGGETLR